MKNSGVGQLTVLWMLPEIPISKLMDSRIVIY
jgi:hypothetical protein